MFGDPAESPDTGGPLRLVTGEPLILFLLWGRSMASSGHVSLPGSLCHYWASFQRVLGPLGGPKALGEVHTLPPQQWGCSYFPCPLPLPNTQTEPLRPVPDPTPSAGCRVNCLDSFLKPLLPRLDTTTHKVAEEVTEAQKDEVTCPQSRGYNVSECSWTKAAEMLGADLVSAIPCGLHPALAGVTAALRQTSAERLIWVSGVSVGESFLKPQAPHSCPVLAPFSAFLFCL